MTRSPDELKDKSLDPAVRQMIALAGDGGHLIGLVMIGRIERAGLYRYLIREQRDIGRFKAKMLAGSLHAGDLAYGA